jgi:hypothetical protein
MTCPGCQEAETHPKNWEIFYAGCQSCEARAVLRDEAAQRDDPSLSPTARQDLRQVLEGRARAGRGMAREVEPRSEFKRLVDSQTSEIEHDDMEPIARVCAGRRDTADH